MQIGRLIANEIAKAGGNAKIIHENVMCNISPEIEWLKWLSYKPEFERQRIEYLNSKKISELSYEEHKEAQSYIKNEIFVTLFKKYTTNECSKEDYMKVYDYMCNESIEKLMVSKLTLEELQYAKEEIDRLSELPKKQLNAKVKEEQKPEKYAQLSMVDAYILHIISDINYSRNIATPNKYKNIIK